MAPQTFRSLCLTLLAFSSVITGAEQIITAEAGENVTLPCGAEKEKNIIVVRWFRPDLVPDGVLLFRDGRFETDDQHPSFRNRVNLQDRQMKDGDASLILKDVTIKDTGTYECRVYQGEDQERNIFKTSIHLVVSPPPGTQEGGGKEARVSLGLTVGLTVVSLLCVLVGVTAAWIYFRKLAFFQRNSQHLPVDQREPKQL